MRICGECTACCTNAKVPELNKPERVQCHHCSKGCQIYEERPASCASFDCMWLQGWFNEEHRPDKSGVMLEKYPKFIFAMCNDNEWQSMRNVLEPLAIPVVVSTIRGNHLLLPQGSTPDEVIGYVKEALHGNYN